MTNNIDELLIKLKSGDEEAFELLYKETQNKVFYTILAITKNYQLSQELMQDTYIKIRQNAHKYKQYDKAMQWIITIARNLAINSYNRAWREIPIDHMNSDYIYDAYSIDDNDTYNTVINMLDDTERQIVIMHIITGLKHKEIASIMNKPLGTVLWIYNKAIKKLRKGLEEDYG